MHDREPPESGTDDQLFLIPDSGDDGPSGDASFGDLAPLASRLQEDLELVRSLPQQLSRALGAIREVVGEIASAQDAIGEEIRALRARHEEDRAAILGSLETSGTGDASLETIEARFESVEAAFEGIEGRFEELGKRLDAQRDGIEEAVRTGLSDRLDAQTEALQKGLGDRERLAKAIEGLRDRLVAGLTEGFRRLQDGATGAIDAAAKEEREAREALPGEVAEQVSTHVAAEVTAALADAGPAWSGEEGLRALREMSDAQREMEKAARAMRAELDRVRKRIEAWGRARSSARIADEVGALEERVVELEAGIESRLADEVADRLSRVFDRRFEALVQLIDARTTAPPPLEDETERRGLFRRR